MEVLKSLFVAPPPPPPPPPSFFEIPDSATLTGIALGWLVPAMLLFLTTRSGIKKTETQTSKQAVTSEGAVVPLDIERRKIAQAEDQKAGIDLAWQSKKQQMLLAAFFFIPHLLAIQYQTAPTVYEQVSGWAQASYDQLTDGKVTLPFQLAVAALFVERICYTWVHTFSSSFVGFCGTAIGKRMGRKPLDVVLTIFYINKVIQLGTFFTFYFHTIDYNSPFDSGFAWSKVTPFQWIWLLHGMVIGQGLNTAIYRAIGKAGVYYGYRLDEPVPWVTGFPFSVVPHPQYFGVCVCCIGVNTWAATPAHVAAGWFNLTAVQVLYYVYMGLVEDYL